MLNKYINLILINFPLLFYINDSLSILLFLFWIFLRLLYDAFIKQLLPFTINGLISQVWGFSLHKRKDQSSNPESRHLRTSTNNSTKYQRITSQPFNSKQIKSQNTKYSKFECVPNIMYQDNKYLTRITVTEKLTMI